MFIEPDTTIWILKDVPLDPTYDHTIYWDDEHPAVGKAAQHAYFASKAKYTLTDQMYQRVQRGYINAYQNAEDLYDCNYVMFQNHAFGNKYFYAFIKSVEYVNNGVAKIGFEIDIMQTWFFDYFLEECFVEREHSATDELFENIVAEDLNLGDEYMVDSVSHVDMNDMMLCILANRKLAGGSSQLPPSEIVNNVLTPLRIYENIEVKASNIPIIDSIFNSFNEDDIVCVYEYPKIIYKPAFPDLTVRSTALAPQRYIEVSMIGTVPIPENSLRGISVSFGNSENIHLIIGNDELIPSYVGTNFQRLYFEESLNELVSADAIVHLAAGSSVPNPVVSNIIQMNTTIDGYIPKNNKLFCSPYNKLVVSNNCGKTAEYKWEYLNLNENNVTEFKVRGAIVSTPSVICYPTDYRGITDDYDSGIIYGDFPQCCWSGDTFKAWWAQNKASFVTSGVTDVISTLVGGAIGAERGRIASNNGVSMYASINKTQNTALTGLSIANTVAASVAKIQDIKNSPSQTHGQAQTDSLNLAVGRVRFSFYKSTINSQYARIIDDYFERFGYATKRNKYPNTHARPCWCYTKTAGCTIKGSIPADDATAICEIYNNGITFWMNPNRVGDYTQDNRPISQQVVNNNG